MQTFAVDQTRLWTIVPTGCVFMPRYMFIITGNDGSCASYDIENLCFDHVSGELPFCLLGKLFEALTYFGLYSFSLSIRTAPLLTALAIKLCADVN